MSLTITVYHPVEIISSPDPSVKEHQRFCMVHGTTAEIQASSPPGSALGDPSDSSSLWKYNPVTGWKEVISSAPAPL